MFDIISDTVHVYVLVFIQCNCATIKLMRSSQKYKVARDVLIIIMIFDTCRKTAQNQFTWKLSFPCLDCYDVKMLRTHFKPSRQ